MTLTDQDRRDRIDATAGILTDLGLPTLAARLRDVIDELLPEPTPAPAPAWSPVVGGWAEHAEWGRVLVVESNIFRNEYLCAYADRAARSVAWADAADLSAPVPRVWDRAEDVPTHVVVRDIAGVVWAGDDLIADDAVGIGHPLAPFIEVLPEGGVW